MLKTLGINYLEKIKNDDLKAFEKLFFLYYEELGKFAFIYLKNGQVAEEIVQDLFIAIWEKRKEIKIQTSIKSYLYSATKNRCLNFLRANRQKFEDIQDNTGRNENLHEDSVHDYLEYNELQAIIDEAIMSLPDKCKEIFLLSRNNELSYQQIADKLNLSIKTVENQLGIALKKLRVFLMPHVDKLLGLIPFIIRYENFS